MRIPTTTRLSSRSKLQGAEESARLLVCSARSFRISVRPNGHTTGLHRHPRNSSCSVAEKLPVVKESRCRREKRPGGPKVARLTRDKTFPVMRTSSFPSSFSDNLFRGALSSILRPMIALPGYLLGTILSCSRRIVITRILGTS